MIRRIKVLGLAALAIAAVSAVSASAASAVEFTSAKSPTFLRGEQTTQNLFTVSGGTVKCTGAVFTSKEITGTKIPVVKVHPEYTGCTSFGQASTITTTGCDYWLTASSTTAGAVEIVCSGGAEIVVKANIAGCTVKVPGQKPTTPTVEYAVAGSPTAITLTSKVEGIKYTSSGGICGASGVNGKYTGAVLTKGYDTAAFTGQHNIGIE